MKPSVDDSHTESLSNAELMTLLKRLNAEECHISQLCAALDTKLQILRSCGETTESASEMESTLLREREITARLLELHAQMSELRIERSRRLSALRASPAAAVKWRIGIAWASDLDHARGQPSRTTG